jgi:hypothetical protein
MIFGIINPPASTVHQVSPFSSTTQTANLITAIARPYQLGSTKVHFEVIFGNGNISGDTVTNFVSVVNSNTTLGQSSIESWGLDDSVILGEIATQMGTNIVQILTGSTDNYGI